MRKKIIQGVLFLLLTLFLPFTLTKLFSNKGGLSDLPNIDTIQICSNSDGTSMNLDEYVCGVVLANIPLNYEYETLKAQAVIARTYALKNIMILDSKTNTAIIDSVTTNSSAYTTQSLGLSYMDSSSYLEYADTPSYDTYISSIRQAVADTKGEVITYHNELITPLFFSTCAGKTRDSKDIWSMQIPYLKSVDSNQDIESSNYMKVSLYTVDTVVQTLNNAYKQKLLEVADYDYQVYDSLPINTKNFFSSIKITSRDSAGYVLSLSIGDILISGDSFANVLGLNSSCFYIENYENSVRFICNGSGHGIGFSQYGANVLAKRDGYTYKELLQHYYNNIKIEKIN